MKNFVSLFVILLVCIGCWIPVASAQDEVPFHERAFRDTVFRDVVGSALSENRPGGRIKDLSDPITQAHMEDPRFTELSRYTRPFPTRPLIKDLTGIEYATSLTTLDISNQEVSDLSPIAGLTGLTDLTLNGNEISDLTPLRNLTNLTVLAVSRNDIRDTSPLGTLTSLTTLYLSDNPKNPSNNPTLGVNLAGLRSLTNLIELRITSINARDIQPLEGLTNLKTLIAYNNQIRDLSPLRDLENLRILNIAGNGIRDISPLTELTFSTLNFRQLSFLGDSYYSKLLSYPSLYTHLPLLLKNNPGLNPGPWSFNFSHPNYRVPTTLESVSSDGQTVVSGEALPEPLVVMVLDENEERFAGVPVTFAVTEGDGTVEPAETTALDPTYNLRDEEEGEAQTTFTAGESLGQQTVVATVTHEDTTLQATFTINVQPGAIAAPTIATVDLPLPTTLPVRWAAPSYAVQSYEIRYRIQDSEAWTVEVLEGTETRFTLPDLIPGTTYEWQVRAETEVGFAPWSPSGFATTGIAAPTIATVDPPHPPRCP